MHIYYIKLYLYKNIKCTTQHSPITSPDNFRLDNTFEYILLLSTSLL